MTDSSDVKALPMLERVSQENSRTVVVPKHLLWNALARVVDARLVLLDSRQDYRLKVPVLSKAASVEPLLRPKNTARNNEDMKSFENPRRRLNFAASLSS